MKFGQVDHPENIDFSLPPTPPETFTLLEKYRGDHGLEVFVGCAKWNRQDLKGFYPRGTKDELSYYATQFNSIELNATFYNSPSAEQVAVWRDKTPADFKFFPKIPQSVSHYSRLLNTGDKVTAFCDAISHFEDKLGMAFLQMHDNYKPKDMERLAGFLHDFPKVIPLAVEVRNAEWFADKTVSTALYQLFESTNTSNVLVDTAGRRDMLHMRMTTPSAFVRYVGANHASDYARLDEWVGRVGEWRDAGLKKLYFFIHQNLEVESPLLATHFISKLNTDLGLDVRGPRQGLL